MCEGGWAACRDPARSSSLPTGGIIVDPDQTAIRWELERVFVELLERVPDRCAVVIRLVVEGFTQREIAERLGIGVSGVEKQVARGKRLLVEGASSFEDGRGKRWSMVL